MRFAYVTLIIGIVLAAAPGASGKGIRPGDLLVCNHARCATVASARALRAFSAFYYGQTRVAAVGVPALGSPAFDLRLNGSPAGVVAGARLNRVLVYGLNCERFHRGTWYRLPARAALEVRRLTAALRPVRVSLVVPRSC